MRKLVIIPAYNESKNIEKVIASINQHNPDVDILVVDDHSADNTGELAKKSGAYVIRHTINGGYGTALRRTSLLGLSSPALMCHRTHLKMYTANAEPHPAWPSNSPAGHHFPLHWMSRR